MSTEIQLFSFQDAQVRVVTIDGEPWFVASDVAALLGYRDAPNMLRMIRDRFRGYSDLSTPGGVQRMATVSEAGLMQAIMRSKRDEAEGIQDWVYADVLPTIRKHGAYLTADKVEEVLSDPDTLIRLATDLKAERAKRAELEAKAAKDAPKVLFADAVATSNTTILVADLAKILRGNGVVIGQNRLFQWLRDEGYLIRRKGADWNSPTQRAMELGLFVVKETAIAHSDGHVSISKTTKVTGKGQQFLVRKFLSRDEEAS